MSVEAEKTSPWKANLKQYPRPFPPTHTYTHTPPCACQVKPLHPVMNNKGKTSTALITRVL